MPQFSPCDLFLTLVDLIKITQLAKSNRHGPWISFSSRQEEKICVKHVIFEFWRYLDMNR